MPDDVSQEVNELIDQLMEGSGEPEQEQNQGDQDEQAQDAQGSEGAGQESQAQDSGEGQEQEEETAEGADVEEGEEPVEEPEQEEDTSGEDIAEQIRRNVMEFMAQGMAKLQSQAQQPAEQAQQGQQTQQQTQTQQPVAGVTLDISDDELEEAITSPTKLKEVLTKVQAAAVEKTLRSVLPLVNETVLRQLQIKTLVDNFYRENEDLAPYKEFVGFVANVVAGEHPDWTYDKVLSETAKIARQKLLLEREAAKKQKAKKRSPVRKPQSARQQQPQLDKLEQEILELIS